MACSRLIRVVSDRPARKDPRAECPFPGQTVWLSYCGKSKRFSQSGTASGNAASSFKAVHMLHGPEKGLTGNFLRQRLVFREGEGVQIDKLKIVLIQVFEFLCQINRLPSFFVSFTYKTRECSVRYRLFSFLLPFAAWIQDSSFFQKIILSYFHRQIFIGRKTW